MRKKCRKIKVLVLLGLNLLFSSCLYASESNTDDADFYLEDQSHFIEMDRDYFSSEIGETDTQDIFDQEEQELQVAEEKEDLGLLELVDHIVDQTVDMLIPIKRVAAYCGRDGTPPVPLLKAAAKRDFKSVKKLLEDGLDPNVQDSYKYGETPLMRAVKNGDIEIIKLLLEKGADPDIQDKNGITALMISAKEKNFYVANLLLEQNANLDLQSKDGSTALMYASDQGDFNNVRLFLEKEADPNIQDKRGSTTLIRAARNEKHEIVEVLLEYEADPDVQDEDGSTVLIEAANNGMVETAKLLLENNADPSIKNKHGRTMFDIKDDYGETILTKAVEDRDYDAVRLFLKKGANPNTQNTDGSTPLLKATENLDFYSTKMLLNNGADPNIQNDIGLAAIVYAADNGDYNILNLLLKKGADPNAKDRNGQSSLNLAKRRNCHDCIVILEKHIERKNRKQNELFLKEFFSTAPEKLKDFFEYNIDQTKNFLNRVVESELSEEIKKKIGQLLTVIDDDRSSIDPKFAAEIITETVKGGVLYYVACDMIITGAGLVFGGPAGAMAAFEIAQLTCPAVSAVGAAADGLKAGLDNVYLMESSKEKSKGNTAKRKINPSKAESKVWRELKPYKKNIKTNGLNGKDKRYYKWDYTHNDIEVYDRNMNHLGSIDPMNGNMIKGPKH